MNFFATLLQQPPVPDKDNNINNSDDSDQFIVTRGNAPKGFNDDVSQIQAGSQHINQDSFIQMKKQHKLLSGQQQSDKRSKHQANDSKQYSQDDQQFQMHTPSQLQSKKKDSKNSKNSKLSLQSKMKQVPTAQFVNLHRQYSVGNPRNLPLSLPVTLNNKKKKINAQIHTHLAELKKLKSHFRQVINQETKKYRKLIQTIKINVQMQIKKKFATFAAALQLKSSTNMKKSQNGQEVALKSKLRQAQNLINQYKIQLDQITQQNVGLQQQVFDLQQKIVGVDLQVEQRFENKRKQLQKKIYDKVTNDIQVNGMPVQYQRNRKRSHNQIVNKQSGEVVQNLILQNEALEAKIKSYQKMLLQADQFRKMKQNVQQRQIILGKKQNQIQTKKSQVQQNLKMTQRKSVDLSMAEQSLNKQLNDLKQNLRVKQEQLLKWQEELMRKSWQIKQKQNNISPKNSSSNFQPTAAQHIQSYNVTFQKPVIQSNKQSMALNYRSPSDQQFSRKIQTLNFQKITQKQYQKSINQLETFRNNEEQNKQRSQTERIFKKDQISRTSPNKISYDPRKHQQYEQFDMHQRQKNNFIHTQHLQTDRVSSPSNGGTYHTRGNKKIQFDGRSQESSRSKNKLGSFKHSQHTQVKRTQFYQPVAKNSFKYEPYVSKPLSTPINNHNPVRLVENYRTTSPHSRQNHTTNSFNKGSHGMIRDKYYQPNFDKSSYSRSSKDNSLSGYGQGKGGRISYKGYDMNKSKGKYEVGKLNELGSKIQCLKNELKSEIDSIY